MNTLGVLIAELQPFDNGHYHALEIMAENCEHLLVLVAGANRATTIHRPFTLEQRLEMVDAVESVNGRPLDVAALNDEPGDDDQWGKNIHDAVTRHLDRLGIAPEYASVGLGCFTRRGHLAGLTNIPHHWTWIDLESAPMMVDPVFVRTDYLRGGARYGVLCPNPVATILDWFYESPEYNDLAGDQTRIEELQKMYGDGPFQTADAVLEHGDKILTIKRPERPNRGATAFPGGLVDSGETPLQTCLRELSEEVIFSGSMTNADIEGLKPIAEVESTDPYRDPRYQTKTTAFLFRLSEMMPLPDVTAASDAVRAEWIEKSSLTPHIMWADHGFLLRRIIAADLAR